MLVTNHRQDPNYRTTKVFVGFLRKTERNIHFYRLLYIRTLITGSNSASLRCLPRRRGDLQILDGSRGEKKCREPIQGGTNVVGLICMGFFWLSKNVPLATIVCDI